MEHKIPQRYVSEVLAEAIRRVYNLEVEPEVVYAEPRFGDFQTNAAMKLAKELGRSPRDIAGLVSEQLQGQGYIKSVEVAGPGFINVTLTDEFWRSYLEKIDDDFVTSSAGKGEKVQVEFISANPTGPPTIGNARGGFVGDVLANTLEVTGHEVTREYYFNNAGGQISKLVDSVKVAAGLIEVDNRSYRGEYIEELAHDFKQELVDKQEEELKEILTDAIFERYIKPVVAKMGISFDVWFNEKDLLEDGTFDSVVQLLNENDLLYEKEGALWLDSGRGGDPRSERVFIKSNGQPAYFAPDVAYHVNIFRDREFDKSIKVLGADHVGQFPSVKAAISLLFPDKDLQALIVQWVRLIKDGEEFKISKRAGTYVTVDELIERVGADVARWFMVMRSNDTHMDFDLDLATEQSQKNPFWYVMYAYVRAHAIVREAGDQGIEPAWQISELNSLEQEIAKKLSCLPGMLEDIASDYQVHHLTFYGRELAKLFHEWYETVRVVDLPPEEASEKLYFLQRFIRVMNAYWRVLGITPRERM